MDVNKFIRLNNTWRQLTNVVQGIVSEKFFFVHVVCRYGFFFIATTQNVYQSGARTIRKSFRVLWGMEEWIIIFSSTLQRCLLVFQQSTIEKWNIGLQ